MAATDDKSSPTLTHAPTVSDHGDLEMHPVETTNSHRHLEIPHARDRHGSDGHFLSPAESQDQASRLADDLTLLQAERAVSNEENEMRRSRSRLRTAEGEKHDVFNQPAPAPAIGQLPESPNTLKKVFDIVRNLPRIIRYFFYSLPITAILLIPIFLGIFLDPGSQAIIGGPGGVQLLWFGIWLEVVWLSLWLARIVCSVMPYVLGLGAKITGSGNFTKWKDIGRQLELHLGLFLWLLALLISFLPIVNTHKVAARVPEEADTAYPDIRWINVVNKIIIALFVLATLNFVEKILIQWIAASFHQRTYSNRIEVNKQSIAYLVYLYEHSKDRLVSAEAVMGTQVCNP